MTMAEIFQAKWTWASKHEVENGCAQRPGRRAFIKTWSKAAAFIEPRFHSQVQDPFRARLLARRKIKRSHRSDGDYFSASYSVTFNNNSETPACPSLLHLWHFQRRCVSPRTWQSWVDCWSPQFPPSALVSALSTLKQRRRWHTFLYRSAIGYQRSSCSLRRPLLILVFAYRILWPGFSPLKGFFFLVILTENVNI